MGGGREGEEHQKSEQLRGRQHLCEIGTNIPLAELIAIASSRGPKVVSPLAFMSSAHTQIYTYTDTHTDTHTDS